MSRKDVDPLARWSRTNRLIIAAAERLGVGWEPLGSEHSDFFLRLSYKPPQGPARKALISKTRSPFLTEVAQTLANNKFLAREQLGLHGLPVVDQLLLDDRRDPSSDPQAAMRARTFLVEHGELVVKPNWGNRGVGVVTGVHDFDGLLAAYRYARELDRDEEVVLEPQVPGTNLRVAIVGGRFVAAAEIRRPQLVGDGQRTIRELVAALNDDPRRASWREPALLVLDEIELEMVEERLEPERRALDDVLALGETIELSFDEVEVIDRSDELHPGWIGVAVEAARLLGVDVAGVDLRGSFSEFCEGPPRASEHAVLLEVNALPALHLHAIPTQGRSRPVFEAFVEYCLQLPGAPPIVAGVGI